MHAIRIGAVVISIGLLLSLTGPATHGRVEAAPTGSLTIGAGTLPDTMDPHLSLAGLAAVVYGNVFDTLTTIDFGKGTAEVAPVLASSWRLVNPTTWEFKLKSGIQFSNGEPFTAEAVKFNIDRILDPATKSPVRGRIATVESAQVVDPTTVRVVTKSPDPILPKRMAVVFIVPPKYFERVGAKQFASKPIGSGPFCVDSYVPLQQLVLSACARVGRTAPQLAQIKMVQIPEAASRVAALRSGGVQAITGITADQVDLLKKEGFQISHAVAARTMMMMLRAQTETPLRDRNVRLALSYAVDSDAIFNTLVKGLGALASGQPIGPDGFGHNPAIKGYPYDPAKTRELLAKAGFPNGFTITMDATNGAFVADKDTAQSAQAYLQTVGVNVKIVTVEYGEFLRRTDNGTHEPIFLAPYNYFPVMDGDFVLQWFWSKHPVKVGTYPDFDRLFEASRQEMDPKKREELLRGASKVVHDEAAAVFLFRPPDIYALAPGVTGFAARPDLFVPLTGVSIKR